MIDTACRISTKEIQGARKLSAGERGNTAEITERKCQKEGHLSLNEQISYFETTIGVKSSKKDSKKLIDQLKHVRRTAENRGDESPEYRKSQDGGGTKKIRTTRVTFL